MGTYREESECASFLTQTSFFQLCGSLLAFTGWCLCISATLVGQWRQWEVGNSTKFQSGVMWVGIWAVCYKPDIPLHSDDEEASPCVSFDAGHSYLPTEIFIAQDLMSLCAVVQTLTLGFIFVAYWNMFHTESEKNISFTFFTIGGLLSLISGTVILIPVTWNMLAVLNNQSIHFPESFGMPFHPKKQFVGVAIHFGFASAMLQIVSGLLFLSKKCSWIHKIYPLRSKKGPEIPSRNDSENCPQCGSSINITTSGFFESSKHKRLRSETEINFQIPMGPIPDQRVAHSDTTTSRITSETAYF